MRAIIIMKMRVPDVLSVDEKISGMS